MRHVRRVAVLIVLSLIAPALPCRADAPPASAAALRLVPVQADLVLQLEQPRPLHDAILALDAVRQVKELDALREYYDSTNFRRFMQLLAHFEKKLGAAYPDLLDRLAGGGAALAVRFETEKPPVLLVVQGKDAAATREFTRLVLEIITQELARAEKPARPAKIVHRGVEGSRLGNEFFIAAAGQALLVTNSEKALKAAIDLHCDGDANSLGRSPEMAEARKLLGGQTLASFWVNLKRAREFAQFKVAFDTFTTDPTFTLFIGGVGDAARRAPFVCGGLSKTADGFAFDVCFPRGRDGMGEAARLVLPAADQSGTLPLLAPKNVQFSMSYYLDLKTAWQNREKLLNKDALKGIGELEKNSAYLLGGTKLSKLLAMTGPHQRFVQAAPAPSTIYKKAAPKQRISAFAVVQEVRDPEFAKTMNFSLRAAGLIGAFKFNLRMVEEKVGDVTLVTYRFAEDKPLKEDPNNVRYNFSPCFALIGDQFFAASTVELGREMVGLLRAEAKARTAASMAPSQMRFYAQGAAASLRAAREQLITQAVLAQALTPEAAREQADAIVRLIAGLGTASMHTSYTPTATRLSIRAIVGKR